MVWSKVDLLLGRSCGEEPELGNGNGTGAGRRERSEGYVFADLEVVKITSADFNPERPPLTGRTKSKIKGWLIDYMPKINRRRVLQIPLDD